MSLGLRSPLFGLIFDRLAHEVYFSRNKAHDVTEAFVGALAIGVARGIERSLGERPRGQLAAWQLHLINSLVASDSFERRLTVEQLAVRCAVSPRHLMRGFKASTGLTLHQYINEARMRKAMDALKAGELPLKSLAGDFGFCSPSAFTAAFRQTVGCTPSEFRSKARLLS